MTTPQLLKGFRDFLPSELRKRTWLKNTLSQICEQWGYNPLETPTLEPLELFKGSIGEDEKLFFHFKDHGGRDVALRYDQTLPTVRVIAEHFHNLTLPFKRYQIQSAFRAEKPQKGRYREFIQCDADIFGDPTPFADAETIALSLEIYRQLGFKQAIVLINDRDLIKDIPYQAIVSIDKLKKIGKEAVIEEMINKGFNKQKALDYLQKINKLTPSESIEIILKYLENYGFDKNWFEFDPTIARSFSYSQGPIWEVVIPEYSSGSVLGGERYDGLFKKIFGIDMSGTGFGLGFDRTLEAADQLNLIPETDNISVFVCVFNLILQKDSLKIAQLLRQNKIIADTYTNPETKLDKQLKYADKRGYHYSLIIGPDESKNNTVTLRNMQTKEQKTITLDILIRELSK